MTADPLPYATRVREARRSSKVACGHYVLTGQVIICRGGKWACLPCALAATTGRKDGILSRERGRHE